MLIFQYFLLVHIGWAETFLEQGKYIVSVKKDQLARIPKNLYKGSYIGLAVAAVCEGKDKAAGSFQVEWMIRSSMCFDNYVHMTSKTVSWYYANPDLRMGEHGDGVYQKYQDKIECSGSQMTDYSTQQWLRVNKDMTELKKEIKEEQNKHERKRRAPIDEAGKPQDGADGEVLVSDESGTVVFGHTKSDSSDWKGLHLNDVHKITTTPSDSQYLLIIGVKFLDEKSKAELKIIMHGPKGYLSAHEYPLLNFYMVMCIVYILYGVIWLVFSGMNYKELLRIQFWIGGVIFLGILEKAVSYSEYSAVNNSGLSLVGANQFAETVSALKRSLMRILLIILCRGYGIIKPNMQCCTAVKIISLGVAYFVCSVIVAFVGIDSVKRTHYPDDMDNRGLVFTQIPLACLDIFIFGLLCFSLWSTIRILRVRKDELKLSLYRHFSTVFGFTVVVSIMYLLFDVNKSQCNFLLWNSLWLTEVFWHVISTTMLISIMILWRPSARNQWYAYISTPDEVVKTLTKSELPR